MKDFKAFYIIPAEPEEIYAALTNAATIQLWSGEPAIMEPIPDTEFSLWEGSIEGKNISFETGKMIVQQWYFADEKPDSMVTIKLHPHKKGCSVEVRQTNIPDDAYEDIVSGWEEVYMESLLQFYKE